MNPIQNAEYLGIKRKGVFQCDSFKNNAYIPVPSQPNMKVSLRIKQLL